MRRRIGRCTDRQQIVPLYDRSVRIQPSPVVQLHRAVAIALRDGPEAGLTHIDAVLEHSDSWGFANQGFLYSLADPVFG
jgi:predicted RNA polymerase sigma factor